MIADLLATPSSALEKALCYRVVGNKHGAIDKMHTVEQAVYGKNAFAKVGVVSHCGCVRTMWVWLHTVGVIIALSMPSGHLRETIHLDSEAY